MELLLNLVWLAAVVASAARFAVWSRNADRRRATAVAVATICILALLFPIISITDDLHLKKAVVEEARSMALMPATSVVVIIVVLVGRVHVHVATIPLSAPRPAFVERGPPVVELRASARRSSR